MTELPGDTPEVPAPVPPYAFLAEVRKIYDGDTFKLRVKLGFDVETTVKVRLKDVNTPEIRGEERPRGLVAKQVVLHWMPLGSTVFLISEKGKRTKKSFDRWVASVYFKHPTLGLWYDLADALVKAGHAERV